MDETTFQRELSLLKHRVAQMTSTFQQTRSPYVLNVPSVCHDTYFSDQLFDVKTRLQAMQVSIDALHANTRSRQETQHGTSEIFPPQHNRLALPSGPLFWQLFTSLRTDVQGWNGRLVDLEQNVSDLEDRVDKIDPSYQFTPAGSEDSAFTSLRWSQQSRPQLYATQEQQGFPANMPSSAFNYPYMDDSWPNTNQGSHHSRDSLWGNVELPATTGEHATSSTGPPHAAPEGVAFRDREIAQLEELMRDAQDSLRSKEEILSQKDAEISTLRSERNCQDGRIEELDRISFERASQIQCYGGILAERQREVERLQEECRAKDGCLSSWQMNFQDMQQALDRKTMQLHQAHQELSQLKRENAELRDVDATLARKDNEITELRDFCEAKGSVTQQQEQFISRGATLIEEKDKQIARLDDDYRNKCRERARFGRLLDERDDEIEQLKKSLHQALMPNAKGKAKVQAELPPALPDRPSWNNPMGNGPPSYSPFATAGARSASRGADWTPKAFKDCAMLPHESRRASAWNTGRSFSDHYKFGVPGVATPPSDKHSASRDQRRELRRSDSVKLLQRLALAEEGEGHATKSEAESKNVANRMRLPLDDAIARPPLPAPLPPRNMSSLEGHSRNSRRERDADRQHMPKSRSIEELPQRRLLQAYVEEGESGGERHGDD